jgi:hypothetical protein
VLPLQKAVALHHFEQFGTVGVVDVNANNDGPSRVVLGPLSLEDLVPMPADRNTEVIPVGRTPPASPASIDEEVDYMVAERLASLEGWRAFLAGHQRGAYAQSARAEVAQRLGASAATPGADPTDNRRGYGLSEQLASRNSRPRRSSNCFSPMRLRCLAIRQSLLKLPRMRDAQANRRTLSRPRLKARFRSAAMKFL